MASLAPAANDPAFLTPRPGARALLWVVAAFVFAGLAWSWLARIDTITRGMGRVIPSSELQQVASLEGGVVDAILVRTGERVRQGQVLIRLDPFASTAERTRGQVGDAALRARLARLEAEISGRAPLFDPALVAQAPQLVAAERALFAARSTQLSADLGAARARLDQAERALAEARAGAAARREALSYAERETALIRPMVDKGIEPRASLLRAEAEQARASGELAVVTEGTRRAAAAVSEARAALRAVSERYRSESADALARTKAEAGGTGAALPALERRVQLTEVRSPMTGTVNRLLIKTVGGVARPGEPLVEVVPEGDTLVVEAEIRPSDIGFLAPGQRATVKLTAYDFAVYGSLPGRVERIGADAVADPRTGELFYAVRIRTEGRLADGAGRPLPIVPGMVAEVDILGQKRRVIDYVLTPVERTRQTAFRER